MSMIVQGLGKSSARVWRVLSVQHYIFMISKLWLISQCYGRNRESERQLPVPAIVGLPQVDSTQHVRMYVVISSVCFIRQWATACRTCSGCCCSPVASNEPDKKIRTIASPEVSHTIRCLQAPPNPCQEFECVLVS